MVTAFQEHLSSITESNPASKKFLLAISGGLDSVVLAELFKRSGFNYSIAHCNFQLRGAESDEDENFVKELALKSKTPFFSVRFDTDKFCTENKVSVQMGARKLRYEWLESIRQKNKLDYVVIAHHADDAIETFFINLLRGAGLSGLHGIKEKNENIIRPLLHFYRKDIELFSKENKLKWREDSSNDSDTYERNKIRHHLIPALEEINPNAKESISTTIGNLQRTEQVFKHSMDAVTRKFVRREGERILIHFDFFKDLIPTQEYLFEFIKNFGFNYEQCELIIESIKGQPGKIFLSESHRIVIDRGNILIDPKNVDEGNTVFEVSKELKELSTKTQTYLFTTYKNAKDFIIPKDASKASLDLDKLVFPLTIRKWQEGDRFHPLGMKKPKKVSDFLVDTKVSIPDKEQLHVLVSGKEIAWLIGYRIDERFKVSEATKNVYLCILQSTSRMNNTDQSPILIDKEIIGNLHFPNEEVLTSTETKQRREYELQRAASLGNDKVKIKILFEDNDGIKQVETTVWAVTKDRVVLKHGVTIPIKRIHEIKI